MVVAEVETGAGVVAVEVVEVAGGGCEEEVVDVEVKEVVSEVVDDVVELAEVVVAPDPVTTTVPFMKVWMLQW